MVSRNIWENESKFCVFSIFTTSLQELITESVEKLTWKVSFFSTHSTRKNKTGKECAAHQIIFQFLKLKTKKRQKFWFFYPKVSNFKMELKLMKAILVIVVKNWFIKCRHPTTPQCEKMKKLLLRENFSWISIQCDKNRKCFIFTNFL